MHDVIVIGAGVSGMSFAHYCAEAGLDVLVVDKGASPGGCVQSWREVPGFWTELGAHTCYNSYSGIIGLLEKLGAMPKLLPRAKVSFKLLAGGEVRSIGKELHVLELLGSAPRFFFAKKDGKTVRQFYEPIVGRKNYRDVCGPLFRAVPSQPADDFPAEMMFKTRGGRRKDVLRSFTLEGGLSTVIDAMARTPGLAVVTEAEVASLERRPDGWTARLASGATESARFVALAVPPSAAAWLLRPLLPAAADALGRIRVVRIETVGVIVESSATKLGPAAGIIPVEGPYYSVVTRDTVPDPRYRGFAFHAPPGRSLNERKAEAAALLGVPADRFVAVTRRDVVLPSPRLGHPQIVRDVDAAIAGSSVFVTGNYFAGLSLEDCVQRSKAEAGRLLASRGAK